MSANSASQGKVLLVDDEVALLALHERVLRRAGFDVVIAASGEDAVVAVEKGDVDAVVTDIGMPGVTGLDLLRRIRASHPDLPVVLLTGAPSMESAVEAIALGALSYLLKPTPVPELIEVVARATRLYRLGRAKREVLAAMGHTAGEASDRAGLEASFGRALDSLWVAFQPIVQVEGKGLFGYESLMRTREPTLPHPMAVLDAAERLGRLDELGRRIRELAVRALEADRRDWKLFLNLHPRDLLDDALYELFDQHPTAGSRVVLELTERASLDQIPNVRDRIGVLRKLGCQVAIDDLGAGYAGLSSFVHLEPDIVKLDMSLVRDADTSPLKQKLIASLSSVCRDMNMLVVAEGVETSGERDTVVDLGCHLVQGYHFGRPGPPFPDPSW